MKTPLTPEAIARRNSLVEEHIGLVDVIAKHVMQRLPPCFEFDDLRQAGVFGLMRAAETYKCVHDPTRFLKPVPFPSYAKRLIRGAMLETVRRRHWTNSTHLPITGDVLETPGPTGAESIERHIEHAERAEIVAKATDALNDTHREVIGIYFQNEGQLKGIGKALGVRQSRSSQVLQLAKREVKREIVARGLRAA